MTTEPNNSSQQEPPQRSLKAALLEKHVGSFFNGLWAGEIARATGFQNNRRIYRPRPRQFLRGDRDIVASAGIQSRLHWADEKRYSGQSGVLPRRIENHYKNHYSGILTKSGKLKHVIGLRRWRNWQTH